MVPLTVCFPDFAGPNDLQTCYEYITKQFLSRKKDDTKQVFVHVTCATNDSNVTFVFNAVRDIVVSKALKDSGLSM